MYVRAIPCPIEKVVKTAAAAAAADIVMPVSPIGSDVDEDER